MTLEDMFRDYCRRAKAKYTPEEIAFIAGRNHIIATEDGFVVFARELDEFHVFFAYAAPRRRFKPILDSLEAFARENGIKRICFSTDRPAVMGRLFRGYRPVSVIMGKEMM